MNELDECQLTEAFEFLDELRDTGVTHMNGASPYLYDYVTDVMLIDIDEDYSQSILSDWLSQ